MQLPTKSLERKSFNSGYDFVIGIDEVGMGCLAGPVVVCAVLFDKKFFLKQHKNLAGVRDSKLLSAKQRETFAEKLLKIPELKFQVSYCFPKTIDRLNIYQASRVAMKRAVLRLVNPKSQILNSKQIQNSKQSNSKRADSHGHHASVVLVDGPRKINGLKLDQIPITKGDRRVFSIACASIIAKVFRDKMMTRYAKRYPDYGFDRHKGYGTKRHLVQLATHGPSKIHRNSFAPVANLL